MAEANLLLSLKITPDGFFYDLNVSNQIIRSIMRSWKRRFGRVKNLLVNNVYPLSYRSFFVCLLISTLIFYLGIPTLYLGQLYAIFGKLIVWNSYFTIFVNGVLLWVINILFFKYSLKLLLKYNGWIFEEPKKVTWKTKLWMFTLGLFVRDSNLRSYQWSLPRLPLPSLRDTVGRYIKSAQCIYDARELEELISLAADFLESLGPKLQWYLWFKKWWSSNYVADWWEEYVYLISRPSLMITSNYYCLGILGHSDVTSKRQASRAAGAVVSLLYFRRQINTENLEPLFVSNHIPLCTNQYSRMFNTSRIALQAKDKLLHVDVSNHITVSYRGKYYRINVYVNSRLATPSELEHAFELILQDESDPVEEFIGVLTGVDRDTSSFLRQNYFSSGINKESIESIDTAAFHLVLEDFAADLGYDATSEQMSLISKRLYCGKGYDRWFEKSFNIIVFSDGHVSFIAEHSWGDALVMSHLMESSTSYEMQNIRYGEDGKIIQDRQLDRQLIHPHKLEFQFYNNLANTLEAHTERVLEEIHNLDLFVFRFDDFGKNFGRTNKLSTDSFVQLALQLAYYRENKHFVHTYESATTQFFLEGRTETIRSCTEESCEFVLAMMDDDLDVERKATLKEMAYKAISSHQNMSRLAIAGCGVDRHLFALLVVSKLLNQNSPFLDFVLKEKWGISSSQIPAAQTTNVIFNAFRKNFVAGGFGPTCFHGYGISYFPHEKVITFHVSCLKNAECRDARKFSEQIMTAMRDIGTIISQG